MSGCAHGGGVWLGGVDRGSSCTYLTRQTVCLGNLALAMLAPTQPAALLQQLWTRRFVDGLHTQHDTQCRLLSAGELLSPSRSHPIDPAAPQQGGPGGVDHSADCELGDVTPPQRHLAVECGAHGEVPPRAHLQVVLRIQLGAAVQRQGCSERSGFILPFDAPEHSSPLPPRSPPSSLPPPFPCHC